MFDSQCDFMLRLKDHRDEDASGLYPYIFYRNEYENESYTVGRGVVEVADLAVYATAMPYSPLR